MSDKKQVDTKKPVRTLQQQIEQIRAQLVHTERVRDAALHDVTYLKGHLDCLLGLVVGPTENDTPAPTTDERKANAEEKIRAVIEKKGTRAAKQSLKQVNPPAGQADQSAK
jgi:hypothetical protein